MRLSTFADSKHLGPAHRTYSPGGRFAIFHGNRFGVLHFSLRTAFNAIRFHNLLLFSALCSFFNSYFCLVSHGFLHIRVYPDISYVLVWSEVTSAAVGTIEIL